MGTYDFGGGDFYSFERQYPYVTWFYRYNFVEECLKESARFGEEFGVTMALQNHHSLIRTWKDAYDLVREVNSPWLKICLDLPIMDNLNKDYVANAVRTVGSLQIHSHYGGEYYYDENGKLTPVILD